MTFEFTTLLGGLGLFLLGMTMLSDGLKLAAGPALETILSKATKTRWRGLTSGALTTAMVQSSSAVTVATIGFVNAGLLTLGSGVWVLFGANVGTTATGWIVALAGLKFNIGATALPLIAIGVVMKLAGGKGRISAYGEALAGFGILFYGIVLMQDGFSALAEHWTIPHGRGMSIAAVQLLFGILMTMVMQSSSASIVIAVTAAQSGMIDITGAAAVVIGANVGTTVTAVVAVIGATPNAKRAATAHVLFNIVIAIFGFSLLYWMVPAIETLRSFWGLGDSAATTLALFNTMLNISGVVMMWPVADQMTIELLKRFKPLPSAAAQPQFLDKTALPVPAMAASALGCEVQRMVTIAWQYYSATLHSQEPVLKHKRDLSHLLRASEEFVDQMNHSTMDAQTAEKLASILRVRRYLENVQDGVAEVNSLPTDIFATPAVATAFDQYRKQIESLIQTQTGDPPIAIDHEVLEAIEEAYQSLKSGLLKAGASGEWRVERMERALHRISAQRRSLQQLVKAQTWLNRALADSATPQTDKIQPEQRQP
jgi:phosphate:Na+ symporter